MTVSLSYVQENGSSCPLLGFMDERKCCQHHSNDALQLLQEETDVLE